MDKEVQTTQTLNVLFDDSPKENATLVLSENSRRVSVNFDLVKLEHLLRLAYLAGKKNEKFGTDFNEHKEEDKKQSWAFGLD